jgi:membrane peptidoglycan carboxypeptidase
MLKKIHFKIHHLKKRFAEGKLSRFRLALLIVVGVIAVGFLSGLIMLAVVIASLPNVDNPQNLVAAESSVIMDRNNKVLYTIHGDENRKIVSFENISPYAVQASMAIEDDQFYNHIGIDVWAIMKAMCHEVRVCPQARGGSTITQQFVKNAYLSPERTYTRKLKEILLSLQLESKFSKDEILEMYLNRIPYGSNLFGIEVASQAFFGKPAKELSIAEGAILAAIPKAPTYYSPYGNHKYAVINISEQEILDLGVTSEQELVKRDPNFISKGLLGKTYTYGPEEEEPVEIYVKGRVDFVLGRMEELGYITEEEKNEAIQEAIDKEFQEFREDIKAPHFVMYVKEQLEAKYGKDHVEKGGLRITTTLDYEMQQAAEEAVRSRGEHNEKNFNATNAALVSIDPNNGQILALVGSRDYWNDEIDGRVNITTRPRLPGSSFKPIVYAAAFLQGYAPSTVVYDVRTKFGSWYEPANFDGQFRGPVAFRQALGGSLNIPAVKAGYLAGIPNVIDLARKLGIELSQADDWYGLSLALGAGEATPINMVNAYGTFANGGYGIEPVAVLKAEDKSGNILEEYKAPDRRDLILDPQVAYLVTNVLSDREARPDEYWRNQLTIPGHTNAAKTGTSNKKKDDVNYPFDTWTIGYTRNLATAVWAGNADGTHLSLNASGLDTASHIWKNYMTEAVKHVEKAEFERPEGIKWVKVSRRSGKLPSEHTPDEDIVSEIFASFSTPRDYDDTYQFVEIDKVSGKLATEYTPKEAIEEKAFYKHHSILPDNPNWEKAVRRWAEENDQDEEVPTEYDDVHTAENMDIRPSITIVSPRSQSTISPPILGAWVDIDSRAGVKKVEYYWNDELVYTADAPPYKGNIKLPIDLKIGSKHKLKAIVYDPLYRSSQSSVTVKIGKDETPPDVEFTHPKSNSKLPAGTLASVEIDAQDKNGDILKIEMVLNGELKKTLRIPPYIWQFTVPDDERKHTVKAIAYDHAKNSNSATLEFRSEKSEFNFSGYSRILEPDSNSSYESGESVYIQAYLSEEDHLYFDEIQLLAKQNGERPKKVLTSTGEKQGENPVYNFIWSTPPSGTYEIYLKIILEDGTIHFTRKVPIVIR